MKLTVGQKVLANHFGGWEELEITRVGRKYAYFRGFLGDEIPIEMCDGKMPIGIKRRLGTAYLSKDHYEQVLQNEKAETERVGQWEKLRCAISYRTPDHLTTDQINSMIAMITPPKKEESK